MVKIKIQMYVLVIVVIFTFSIVVAAQGVDPVSGAKKALKSNNYGSLLKYSTQVVSEYPDWFWGYYWKGRAYFGQGDYKKAVQAFTASLDAAEKDDEAYQSKFYIVNSHYKAKSYRNCLKAITSAERTKKSKYYKATKSRLAAIKGYCYYNLKKYKEALAVFKPVLDSGKASADMLKAIGQSYLNTGQTDKAVSVIQSAVRRNPKDIAAHKILVKSYSNARKWKNAASAAEFALSNFRRDWELNYLAGQAFAKLENFTKAGQYLNASIILSQKPKTYYKLAEVYAAKEEWGKALISYEAAKGEYAGDPNFHVKYAYAFIMYVPNDAEKYFRKEKGKVYIKALDQAEKLLKHVLTLESVNKVAIADLSAVLDNKMERLTKGSTFEQIIELKIDPETGDTIRTLISSTDDK